MNTYSVKPFCCYSHENEDEKKENKNSGHPTFSQSINHSRELSRFLHHHHRRCLSWIKLCLNLSPFDYCFVPKNHLFCSLRLSILWSQLKRPFS